MKKVKLFLILQLFDNLMPKQWTCENDVLKSFGSYVYVIIHIYAVD